uniref:MADS-box domain-containing protein n=1 Tax=Chenopodium quinoa TaxID=63459 RepID=A0A803KXU1_CHEQI
MGRAKIAMEFIVKEKTRNATYGKRKKGLLKKAHELSILCNVPVCIIIYPYKEGKQSSEAEVYAFKGDLITESNAMDLSRATDPMVAREMIDRYVRIPNEEKYKRALNLFDMFDEWTKKADQELSKLRHKNALVKYPCGGSSSSHQMGGTRMDDQGGSSSRGSSLMYNMNSMPGVVPVYYDQGRGFVDNFGATSSYGAGLTMSMPLQSMPMLPNASLQRQRQYHQMYYKQILGVILAPISVKRMVSVEQQVKDLELRLGEQQKVSSVFQDRVLKMMQDLSAKLDEVSPNTPVSTPKTPELGSNSTRTLGYVPKLKFPKFDGHNCRLWIKKCNKYFKLCKINDEQKVDLASLNMIDKAEPAVKPFVKAFKPQTLADAVEFARLQEESLEASKNMGESYTTYGAKNTISSSSLEPSTTNSGALVPFQSSKPLHKPQITLTAAERREKQLKGLCYFCDQPYERNHKCPLKQTQLFIVEIPGEDECEEEGMVESVQDLDSTMESIDPQISVHALCGNPSFQIMRVTGVCGKSPLHVLIDSGSTHNFLDIDVARRLGCKIDSISPQAVTVADGNHLACQNVCKGFKWSIQGNEFVSDVLLLSLGSCDMVLGIQWLSMLGTKSKKAVATVGQKVDKVFNQPSQLYFLQLIPDNSDIDLFCLKTEVTEIPSSMNNLIPLEFGADPVSIRPYRYPLSQRDTIEKLVKEMLEQVQKWEQYLTGHQFIIKIDQKSLKWLLQQKISTPFQQLWLSKLMGFNYENVYRSGSENVVADALSRVSGSEILLLALTVLDSNLSQKLKDSYELDVNTARIFRDVQLGPDDDLKAAILSWLHSSGQSGHSGKDATLVRVKGMFYWKGMTAYVSNFVRNCLVCQASKSENVASPGLLQPLPIPS